MWPPCGAALAVGVPLLCWCLRSPAARSRRWQSCQRQPSIRNSPVDLAYSNTATLARSSETTPWLNRDKSRVVTSVDHTGRPALAGSIEEILSQTELTRLGLYRRVDAKFAQFVPRTVEEDGYGIWRNWESQGNCPPELLIRDPWGTISWEADYGAHVSSTECSWVVQPGMFRKDGYIRLSKAPVVLSFKTLSLLTNIEYLDVYDGAHTRARHIARYTGRKVPHQITSSGAELRIVYWVDLNRTATQGWEEIEAALTAADLVAAVRRFSTMARFGVVGYYGQDARRALETMAARLSSKPHNRWMRRKWFRSAGGFAHAYDAAAATFGQDADLWQKRHRHEPGKEGMPWETALGPRKWPQAFVEPEQNPNYHVMETGYKLDFTLAPRAFGGTMSRRILLDFTTTADCRGAAATGKAFMAPPQCRATTITTSTCLPAPGVVLPADGDRWPPDDVSTPFHVRPPILQPSNPFLRAARTVGTRTHRQDVSTNENGCRGGDQVISRWFMQPNDSDSRSGGTAGRVRGFPGCVDNVLQNKSQWKIGRNLYNSRW